MWLSVIWSQTFSKFTKSSIIRSFWKILASNHWESHVGNTTLGIVLTIAFDPEQSQTASQSVGVCRLKWKWFCHAKFILLIISIIFFLMFAGQSSGWWHLAHPPPEPAVQRSHPRWARSPSRKCKGQCSGELQLFSSDRSSLRNQVQLRIWHSPNLPFSLSPTVANLDCYNEI
jgi:hypothetical protein